MMNDIMKKIIKGIFMKNFYFKRITKKNRLSDHFYGSFFSEENSIIVKQSISNKSNNSNICQSGGDIIIHNRGIKEEKE